MGWSGNTREFKNIKKKKELIKTMQDNETLHLIKIEGNVLLFRFIDDLNPREEKFTYELLIPIKMYARFVYKEHYYYDDYIKYTWKDIKEHLIEDYDLIVLTRTSWSRC